METGPLIVRGQAGLGHVTLIGFDCTRAPLRRRREEAGFLELGALRQGTGKGARPGFRRSPDRLKRAAPAVEQLPQLQAHQFLLCGRVPAGLRDSHRAGGLLRPQETEEAPLDVDHLPHHSDCVQPDRVPHAVLGPGGGVHGKPRRHCGRVARLRRDRPA